MLRVLMHLYVTTGQADIADLFASVLYNIIQYSTLQIYRKDTREGTASAALGDEKRTVAIASTIGEEKPMTCIQSW